MTIYGTSGIELAMVLSLVALFGLIRVLVPPWSTIVHEDDVYSSFDGYQNVDNNNCRARLLCELAVETRIFEQNSKASDNSLISPRIFNAPCSICLQCFEIGQEVSVVTACKHTFHSKCLQLWIQKSATCPYCRQDLEKTLPSESGTGEGRRRAGALGIFEGAFDSILDLAT
jgi:hypothetical protein